MFYDEFGVQDRRSPRHKVVVFWFLGMLDIALGVAAIVFGGSLNFAGPDTELLMSVIGGVLILTGAGMWCWSYVTGRRIGRETNGDTVVRTRR